MARVDLGEQIWVEQIWVEQIGVEQIGVGRLGLTDRWHFFIYKQIGLRSMSWRPRYPLGSKFCSRSFFSSKLGGKLRFFFSLAEGGGRRRGNKFNKKKKKREGEKSGRNRNEKTPRSFLSLLLFFYIRERERMV